MPGPYGVTDEGFNLKRLNDILESLQARLVVITDPTTGETLNPVDANDPLVQVVNAISDDIAVAWEQANLAYNQFDPLKAVGAGLAGLVQLNRLRKKAGTTGTAAVIVTGTPAKVIPAGKQISDINGTITWSLPEITIGGGGTAAAIATCDIIGDIPALAGTLVKIITPFDGWTAVNNPGDAVSGTDEETDTELRTRQQVSTSNTADTVIESLYAGLIGLDDVTFVRVYQNLTLVVDSRGIPAKTIAPVVVGGDDDEIANIMFERGGLGVDSYGTTEVLGIIDNQGVEYPQRFSRPAGIDAYVDIEIAIIDVNLFPADGVDQIKAAILLYAAEGASGLDLPPGYDQDGYTAGQSVYASELYTPTNSIPGHQIISLDVGIVSPAVDQSIPIEWDEIAAFDSIRISIVVS